MSEQEAQAERVREALRAGWGEAERRWPGINLAYEARRQSFVEGAEWERARHVPVEAKTEVRRTVAAILVGNGIKPHDPAYYRLIDALSAAWVGGSDAD